MTRLDRDITAGIRPYGLAVSPDGRWALVGNVGRSSTNSTGDADTVSLVDLSREPFRTADTVTVGTTPEGVAAGHPLRGRAQVRLLRVEEERIRAVGETPVGDWVQGLAFSRHGRTLLIGNMADRTIGVYRLEGEALRDTGRRIAVEGGPTAIATAPIVRWPRPIRFRCGRERPARHFGSRRGKGGRMEGVVG